MNHIRWTVLGGIPASGVSGEEYRWRSFWRGTLVDGVPSWEESQQAEIPGRNPSGPISLGLIPVAKFPERNPGSGVSWEESQWADFLGEFTMAELSGRNPGGGIS